MQTQWPVLLRVGGLFSRQARKSQNIVATQLTELLSGLIKKQFADFTSEIVSELNRAGVFDPVERERLISQRLDEAVRLGILPSPSTAGGSLFSQGGLSFS